MDEINEKSKTTAGFFALFFGFIGLDLFYCNKKVKGASIALIYLFTILLTIMSSQLKETAKNESLTFADKFGAAMVASMEPNSTELLNDSLNDKVTSHPYWKYSEILKWISYMGIIFIGCSSLFRTIRYFFISNNKFHSYLLEK